ncbi:alcohol dehydrogenase [Hypoxylon trugodes]|uniref:alcohol dehydrogenase n=1 Tax=Hypoxylon trugodes TaxID=326681 RepID=UPI00218CCB9C|nr:alcohol dehydrogenase [Hypoxylon trugodes]KAI1383445.1 alcohol dehydrogenase [Hypoxylon trugodes]
MKALAIVEKGRAEIREVPIPKVIDGFVLVKVKAVGINPTDWKGIETRTVPSGVQIGLDYAGVVEEVGNGVTNFKKGDRIAGAIFGLNELHPDWGAYAEYLIAKADVQTKIPDNVTDAQAATLGVSLLTVAQGLYKVLKLPWPTTPAKEPFPIFIYAGSAATGVYGIQYAKLSGLTVITTSSPHNFDYLKSLGADAVFDYKSPTVAADIKALTGNKLKYAWDCTGDGGAIVANALTDAEESHYATIMPVDKDLVHGINPKVDGPHAHLGYNTFGEAYKWFGNDGKWGSSLVTPDPEEHDNLARFHQLTYDLLKSGAIKPIRTVENRGGPGLEGVLTGLKELKAGKVSGEKLVYTL